MRMVAVQTSPPVPSYSSTITSIAHAHVYPMLFIFIPFSSSYLMLVLRSLIEFAPESIILQWTASNVPQLRAGIRNYSPPSNDESVCVVDTPQGDLHFFAVSRQTSNHEHGDIAGGDNNSYEIVQCLISQHMAGASINDHLPYPEPHFYLDLEPVNLVAVDGFQSLSPVILPHPSSPLLFAFTPSKIIIIHSIYHHPDTQSAAPYASSSIDLHVPPASASKPGGIWGLAASVKELVSNRLSKPPPPELSPVFDGSLTAAHCIRKVDSSNLSLDFLHLTLVTCSPTAPSSSPSPHPRASASSRCPLPVEVGRATALLHS